MLDVRHIKKRYGEYYAVRDLSFTIDKPGVFALLGTNGAGKTTSIRMILDMLAKDEGEVLWDNTPLSAVDMNIGYLAEERGLYPKYNVMEQLVYFAGLRRMRRADAREELNKWFKRLNIEEHKNKRADQLSKGNQQKVQLIAALVSDPFMLVLDEPMSGLDPVNTELFRDIINMQIRAGKYIIMSSHQMATVEEFCENIVILNKGEIAVQGNLDSIKKSYGRTDLSVKAEGGNVLPYALETGLAVTRHTPSQIDFKVDDEKKADILLRKLIDNNFSIIKFELREPTLHEIFVNSVKGTEGDENA